jgi:hypothetical protein
MGSENTVTGVPIPPDVGLQTTLTSVGAVVTRDTSSNRFYSTGGTFFSFASDFFFPRIGQQVLLPVVQDYVQLL